MNMLTQKPTGVTTLVFFVGQWVLVVLAILLVFALIALASLGAPTWAFYLCGLLFLIVIGGLIWSIRY